MKKGEVNLGRLTEADSYKVIGAVVEALGLDLYRGPLRGRKRTVRRFFDGKSVIPRHRSEIFKSIGEALVARTAVPEPRFLRRFETSLSDLVAQAVERAARRWDHSLSVTQSRSVSVVDINEAADQILRMVVVDLAIRVFAFMRLSGIEVSPPATPLWAKRNGTRDFLRNLVKQSGMTRYELADRLGVSDNSVDNWLDGKVRTTSKNIAALAAVLAIEDSEVDRQRVENQIQNMFALADIADLLATYIGRERVIEIFTALNRFVWFVEKEIDQTKRPSIEENPTAEVVALVYGTEHPSTRELVAILSENEPDESWGQIFRYVAVGWSIAFPRIAAKSGRGGSAAGLSQDISDIYPDPALEELQRLSDASDKFVKNLASQRGGLGGSIRIWRQAIDIQRAIVQKYPLSPAAHYALGSFLGMVGKNLLRRDLVDEGIAECKIASLLRPDWDAPAVEPGIMLANIGAFEEALGELRIAEKNLPQPTPHLQFNLGYVLMELQKFENALQMLESVISERGDYALALKFAARCAFELGDKRKGARYAKAALRYGEPSEYEAWEAQKKGGG